MSRTSLISMADNRGDHGVAVVKALLFTVVVVAHAASLSKPVLRSESSNDETSSRAVRTHKHPTFSAGSSDLVVQNGWGKALLHDWNDKNHTHEHEIDAAGLSESRNALDTVATLLDVKADQDEAKKAHVAGWTGLKSWTLSASTTWNADYPPANIKVASGRPWHDKGSGVNQYIVLDAGAAITLKGFRVKAPTGWHGSAFKNFRFEYALVGSGPWSNAIATPTQGVNLKCCAWQTFSFVPRDAQHYRLYMVDNWGYGWLTIQEMQVDVVPPPTPPPTPEVTVTALEGSAYRTCVGSTSISLLASLMTVSLHRSS